MKLGHLSILIVVIIAVIVAAIITAFSLVTFASLDKAVENSLASEAEFVRTSIQGIETQAKTSVKISKERFVAGNFTVPNLPWQDYVSPVETAYQPQYTNWTDAIALMASTLNHNPEFFFFYLTGPSPVPGSENVWVFLNSRQADTSKERGLLSTIKMNYTTVLVPELSSGQTFIMDGRSPLKFVNINGGNSVRTINVKNRAFADDLRITPSTGAWGRAQGTNSLNFLSALIVFSYHLPFDYDPSTNTPSSYLSIDVNSASIRERLRSQATKGNTLILIDTRNTSAYNGAIIATSKSEEELPIVNLNTLELWPVTGSPNAEVNSIMQTVIDSYNGFDNIRNTNKDAIITDAGDLVIAASHVIGEGNLHFMIVSAIPKKYYFGNTATTIAATIGAGVGFLIVASGIILLIMFEQQKLVEGSKQSVRIAEAVARDLISYNTDHAHESITYALTNETLLDETGEKEEPNYTNKDLIGALKAINENLKMYAPFLPEYILKGDDDEAELAYNNDSKDGEDETGSDASVLKQQQSSIDLHRTSGSGKTRSGLGFRSINSENDIVDMGQNENGGAGDSLNNNNNAYGVPMKMSDLTARSKRSKNMDERSAVSRISSAGKVATATKLKVAMNRLKNRGDYVERLVLCNLNLSRVADAVLPLGGNDGSSGNFDVNASGVSANVRHVNKVIEILLNTASENDCTIHSLVGDSIQATVSAVSRTGHADIKALRFITTSDSLLKKEINEWCQTTQSQRQTPVGAVTSKAAETSGRSSSLVVHPMLDANQFLITGGLVNSSAYCQLGGSDKRQQFLMFAFNEAELMTTIQSLGIRKSMLVCCRTIQQNCNYEYEFRGCGVHSPTNRLFESQSIGRRGSMRMAGSLRNQTVRSPTMMSFPMYELVRRKKLGNADEDEWLYVVGGGGDESMKGAAGIANKVNSLLTQATVELARNNVIAAKKVLLEIKELDPEAANLGAFQNIEGSVGGTAVAGTGASTADEKVFQSSVEA